MDEGYYHIGNAVEISSPQGENDREDSEDVGDDGYYHTEVDGHYDEQ